MRIADRMTSELVDEMEMTRKLLARVPDDKLEWSPSDSLHSIAWNACHLVEIIGWVPGILMQTEWDIMPVSGDPYVVPTISQASQLLERFDDNSGKAIQALNTVDDCVMEESWSLKMGGQIIFTMKKQDCLRKWVFSHSAHHRGILSVYLRMAGLQFSSIYEE